MFEIDGILYAGTKNDMIKILKAEITGKMMMLLTFSSGEQRVFDAEILKGEVYEPLKEDSVFRNFKIVHGVITWMDESIDCAPEYMYENSYAYNDANIAI